MAVLHRFYCTVYAFPVGISLGVHISIVCILYRVSTRLVWIHHPDIGLDISFELSASRCFTQTILSISPSANEKDFMQNVLSAAVLIGAV